MKLRIPRVSLSTLLILVPMLYFNSCTAEFVKHYTIVLPIVGLCVAVWLVLMLHEKKLTSRQKLMPLIPMGLYAGFLVILQLCGLQSRISVLSNNFSNVLFLMVLFCMFSAYSDSRYRKERIFIVSVWVLDSVITCVYSTIRLLEDPTLSRDLSTGSFHQTEAAVGTRGIMSFAGVNGLALILFVWFFILLNKKNKRGIYVISFAAFTVMVFMAQFTIAILMLVAGCLVIVFTNNASVSVMVKRTVILILILIPVLQLLPIAVDNQLFGYEVSHRIGEVTALLSGGEMTETDLLSRFLQYSKSVTAFWNSYGMGKIFFDNVHVGTHSELLDGFGNYGVLYALYVLAFYNMYRHIVRCIDNTKARHIYQVVMLMYLVMSVINTASWAPMILSLFVIIPFVCIDEVSELPITKEFQDHCGQQLKTD